MMEDRRSPSNASTPTPTPTPVIGDVPAHMLDVDDDTIIDELVSDSTPEPDHARPSPSSLGDSLTPRDETSGDAEEDRDGGISVARSENSSGIGAGGFGRTGYSGVARDPGYDVHEIDEVRTSDRRKVRGKGRRESDIEAGDEDPTVDYTTYKADGSALSTTAKVGDDGRLVVTLQSKIPLPSIPTDHTIPLPELHVPALPPPSTLSQPLTPTTTQKQQQQQQQQQRPTDAIPRLNIVIFIVGSRGDVQPFLALARALASGQGSGRLGLPEGGGGGHRVRIATHENFREFVDGNAGDFGLGVRKNGEREMADEPMSEGKGKGNKGGAKEKMGKAETERGVDGDGEIGFFDIGGDPEELMAYMVKNPGLIPGCESIARGDIGRKRKMIREILEGCWRACHYPDQDEDGRGRPFAADVIISNPPAFAHIHCAEALGIPLHLMFTMPWCSTTAFPHPLVNIQRADTDPSLTNYLTYGLSDLMAWQGLGDIINDFRKKTLGLSSLSLRSGPGIVERLRIPWTYAWSPALIPKPEDWMNHIDISGFFFVELGSSYDPPEDLKKFLEVGPPPVYIGFGSIPVDDPVAMTKTIFEAVEKAGVRALVSAGWGGLGKSGVKPKDVLILGNVPHDWLFSRVAAVVHHGGAGTTAIGLREGKPTLIVPFFGDQPFWGRMVHEAGAGPKPIPHKELDTENLTKAIKELVKPEMQKAAKVMGQKIRAEDGVTEAMASFSRHLPMLNMTCDLDPGRVAVWWSERHCLKLSAFGATVLHEAKELDALDLLPHRPRPYDTRAPIMDPITGGGAAVLRTVLDYHVGIGQIFFSPKKGIVNTVTAIPRGMASIVSSVSEGLRNAPRLYGGGVREPDEVKDFKTGVAAGVKSVVTGYTDAITGLAMEPYRGAQKEGPLGALKGFGRGILNASLKPAAGVMGAIEHPVRGAYRSVKTSLGSYNLRKDIALITDARRTEGREAFQTSRAEERDLIVKAFKNARTKEELRRRRENKKMMLKDEREWGLAMGLSVPPSRPEDDTIKDDYGEVDPEPRRPRFGFPSNRPTDSPRYIRSLSGAESGSGTPSRQSPLSSPGLSSSSRKTSPTTLYAGSPNPASNDTVAIAPEAVDGEDEEEMRFKQDLWLATQLSLAEKRGYERGVKGL